MIIITEEDYWGDGIPLYHVDRVIRENGKGFGDSAHIIYVNAEYEGNDRIGLLMSDFRQSDSAKMHYQELANRVNSLKNSEEEVKKMCQAMEITYQEGRNDGRIEGRMEGYVRNIRSLMRRRGMSAEEAMDELEILGDERTECAEQLKEA